MSKNRFLVVIETQRVKGYLFASPILRETRGASLLLDKLNRDETRKLLGRYLSHECIYLGGGSGRLLFDSESAAESFAREVRQLYEDRTTSARVSVEVLPRLENELMSDWIARGVCESQKNKLARAEPHPIIAGRWIRPCSSCGKEAAEVVPPPDIQGSHSLCSSCLKKRQEIFSFYQDVKANWDLNVPLPLLSSMQAQWPNQILTTLSERIEAESGSGTRILLPQDFDQIGTESKPSNYIGFIYADGNRMGEVIKNIGKLFPADESCIEAYRAFSEIVDQSTRAAAVEAVLKHVGAREATTKAGEPSRYIPAEFVLAGGDDLILVVPGHTALPVAATFLEQFQKRTRELQQAWGEKLPSPFAPEGLTSSAGVVLAHSTYPASQLMDIAGDLMKLAKRKSADLARGDTATAIQTGTLDFIVLHESGSEKIKERRKSEYRTHNAGINASLTERPYTASGTLMLLEQIRALKESNVPRNKIKALYPVLFQGILQAQFDGLRLKERLKASGSLEPDSPLERLVSDLNRFPFREETVDHWSTPLTELIEIYDFVQPVTPGLQG